jgi:hypothetical protein
VLHKPKIYINNSLLSEKILVPATSKTNPRGLNLKEIGPDDIFDQVADSLK